MDTAVYLAGHTGFSAPMGLLSSFSPSPNINEDVCEYLKTTWICISYNVLSLFFMISYKGNDGVALN